jgi:hypothetical protein
MELEARRTLRHALTFDSSYTWAKNLADNEGPDTTQFAGENGGARATYINNRHLDFGDVYGTRRHRWLTSATYDLPFGRGKAIGSNWNRLVNGIAGGWQSSWIFLWQTGPYLTPFFNGGDPSGTGSGTLYGRDQHPDRIGSGVPAHQNANEWIDPSAFLCPGVSTWVPGTPASSVLTAQTLRPLGASGIPVSESLKDPVR